MIVLRRIQFTVNCHDIFYLFDFVADFCFIATEKRRCHMAQPLVLRYGGKELPFQLRKVDRSSLYGFVDIETHDDQGRPCKLATLAGDGRTIVDSGGTALAYLSPNGLWREKSELDRKSVV